MTERSILAGPNPTVVIRVGGSVTVSGQAGDRVSADTDDRSGLQIDKGKGTEKQFARARAAVGEHVFFDLRFKLPNREDKNPPEDVIEVQIGGNGEVRVPLGSNVKIYAGRDIDVRGVRGVVDAYAGARVRMQDVYCLGNASAGWTMDLDCQTLLGEQVEFKSGSDLRFCIRELANARVRVKDLGGYWEGRIGAGEKTIYLKCAGDVTLVTDQAVEALPPNYILGRIEKPPVA